MTWTAADPQTLAQIEGSLEAAREWAYSYYVVKVKTWSPGLVQDLYVDALRDLAKGRVTRAQVTSVVGAALGQLFVSAHRFRWGTVEDEHGLAYAVSNAAGAVVFPMDAVAKRIDTYDGAFVGALVASFTK